MPYSVLYSSPLGDMLMQSEDGKSLCCLVFCDGNDDAEKIQQDINSDIPLFADVKSWLDIYFSGANPPFNPPLSSRGTEFQHAVWRHIAKILYGKTATYGEIARRLSEEKKSAVSARAVGGALNRNPIAIIVPCHRVIGKDGALTGYAGGVERKQALLLHEAMASLKGFAP